MKKTELDVRIKRIKIYGILGIIYSAYLTYDYFFKNKITWELVTAISLFIISIIFILLSNRLKRNK